MKTLQDMEHEVKLEDKLEEGYGRINYGGKIHKISKRTYDTLDEATGKFYTRVSITSCLSRVNHGGVSLSFTPADKAALAKYLTCKWCKPAPVQEVRS